jgi:hypothetical protein
MRMADFSQDFFSVPVIFASNEKQVKVLSARQLPDQSTILWVASSFTGDPRFQGALPKPDLT